MHTPAPRPPWTPPSRSRVIAIGVALVATNIGDALFTLYLLRHGFEEINPAMLWLMTHSVWAFLAVKTVVPTLLAVWTGRATLAGHRLAWIALCGSTLVYSVLCLYYAFAHCYHTSICF